MDCLALPRRIYDSLLSASALAVMTIGFALAGDSSTATDMGRRLMPGSPEVSVGDRLFFETRFAQYFYANARGRINSSLAVGDSLVHDIQRPGAEPLPGPFNGQSISCRHCHLGDDFMRSVPIAQRTYADFSARTAIPARDDQLTHTVRNTQQMVDLGLRREVPRLFHFDGEFASAEELVIDTLTGRNMGWQLSERAIAVAHIANVMRNDNGINPRYVRNSDGSGLPYRVVLLGTDPSIPDSLRILPRYRIDVTKASDEEILQCIARLIHAYMDSIRFGTEDTGRGNGSPYDLFLRKNGLPSAPMPDEKNIEYARRLLKLLDRKTEFAWITPADGQFELHPQRYEFGREELAGLKIFLSEARRTEGESVGACVMCHTPPQFTDHRFHNTGVSQLEYDAIFGAGAFVALRIPDLATRQARPDLYLPATAKHPHRLDRFRSVPIKTRPGFADLGVWNIFANEDFPASQEALVSILCGSSTAPACSPRNLLPWTVARFKTPTVRDLGHSNPYFHTGGAATLENVLAHYFRASNFARMDKLRNGASELKAIRLSAGDRTRVVAFLRALNEDYH